VKSLRIAPAARCALHSTCCWINIDYRLHLQSYIPQSRLLDRQG
jgi:hypothetical protein